MSEVTFRSDVTVEVVQACGSEAVSIYAARQSTQGSDAKAIDNARFVQFLADETHTLPFEHNILTLHLEVPHFIVPQILKYRHSSISEESGRYRVLQPVFYVPGPDRPAKQIGKTSDYEFEHDIRALLIAQDSSKEMARRGWELYDFALSRGVAKELARTFLPFNVYKSLVVSMNLVGWLHFIHQRATDAPSHGQYEIALVADQVAAIISGLYPNVWETFVEKGYTLR